MTTLEKMGLASKEAEKTLSIATTGEKNRALMEIALAISERKDEWIKANKEDIENAKNNGMKQSMLDRLLLTEKRIEDIVKGINEVVKLEDPIGTVLESFTRPNGLKIEKRRVPIGVIGIIYEARPNVTVDAAVLTLKAGNTVILKGGKEAINSNITVVTIMQDALEKAGLPRECIQLIEDTTRETTMELMHLTKYVDVLIPRGGKGLIESVCANATVPVIKTGDGVCHIYIDKAADLEMGAKILDNAKTSRPSVCNAAECVVVHKDVVKDFLKIAVPILKKSNVELRCDSVSLPYAEGKLATEEDWDTEYNDYILAVKTVDSLQEAIDFISAHSTMHSEAIVTEDPEAAEEFLNKIDAAAVYWNASTRFTDGGEFGLGAEIGISTQKMHARGPMGLNEITSYKYVIIGKGQVR